MGDFTGGRPSDAMSFAMKAALSRTRSRDDATATDAPSRTGTRKGRVSLRGISLPKNLVAEDSPRALDSQRFIDLVVEHCFSDLFSHPERLLASAVGSTGMDDFTERSASADDHTHDLTEQDDFSDVDDVYEEDEDQIGTLWFMVHEGRVTAEEITRTLLHDHVIRGTPSKKNERKRKLLLRGERSLVGMFCGCALTLSEAGDVFAIPVADATSLKVGHPRLKTFPLFSGLKVSKVACGQRHVLVITQRGKVMSMGHNTVVSEFSAMEELETADISGQLGHSLSRFHGPHEVEGLDGRALHASCGMCFSTVITTKGTYTFGSNEYGELARPGPGSQYPVLVQCDAGESPVFLDVQCGGYHAAARTQYGDCWVWGRNREGQLGVDVTKQRVSSPTLTTFHQRVAKVSCGLLHTVLCTHENALYVMGSNFFGELGMRTSGPCEWRPQQLILNSTFREEVALLRCGAINTTVLTTSGLMYTWGMTACERVRSRCPFAPHVDRVLQSGLLYVRNAWSNAYCHVVQTSDHMTESLDLISSACSIARPLTIVSLTSMLMSLKDRALAIPHLLKLVQSKMKQDRNGAVTLVEVSNPYEEIVLVGKKTHTHTFNIINLCPHVARVEIEMQHAPRDAGIRIRMEPSMFVLGGHASMKISVRVKSSGDFHPAAILYPITVKPVNKRDEVVGSRNFVLLTVFKEAPSVHTFAELRQSSASEFESRVSIYLPRTLKAWASSWKGSLEAAASVDYSGAIMLLDIKGFSQLCNQLERDGDASNAGPEIVSRHLNSYFGELMRTVDRHGGDLLKSIGDALLCSFGAPKFDGDAPIPLEQSAMQALQCALDVQSLHSKYNSGGITLELHIGLSVGTLSLMVVGGFNNRWEHIVLSPALDDLALPVQYSEGAAVMVHEHMWNIVSEYCHGEEVEAEGGRVVHVRAIHDDWYVRLPELEDPPSCSESTLRLFVRQPVLSKLQSNRPQWVDEYRVVTSLFVQLSFPRYVKESSTMRKRIQEVVFCIQSRVMERGGIVCNFFQDEKGVILFAAFGLPPFSHADDPVRAVTAGIELRRELHSMVVPCAIGICTGKVFSGVMGHEGRQEYIVIGHTINMCARLMAEAGRRSCDMLCDKNTRDACADQCEFDEADAAIVKGSSAPVAVFVPTSVNERRWAPSRSRVGGYLQPVGREKEIGIVQRLIANSVMREQEAAKSSINRTASLPKSARGSKESKRKTSGRERASTITVGPAKDGDEQGAAQAVLLTGSAGVGKTHFIAYATQFSALMGVKTLSLRCLASMRSLPFAIIGMLLPQVLGLDTVGAGGDALRWKRLKLHLPSEYHAHVKLLDPVLNRSALSSEPSPNKIKSKEAVDTNRLITAMIVEVVARCIQKTITVLTVDNVDWMDESSLRTLISVMKKCKLLICFFVGEKAPSTLIGYAGLVKSEFTPLSAENSRKLVQRMAPVAKIQYGAVQGVTRVSAHMLLQLNTKELPPNFEPFIVGAHGNPGYLKEVVLNLQQRGLLTQENGEWRLECSDVEEALPSTLKAFISSRIDLLPLPAQTCLKIASVIGMNVDLVTLQGVYPHPTSLQMLRELVSVLERAQLVVAGTDTFQLVNHTLAAAAYERLLVSQRRSIHQAVAEYIEGLCSETGPSEFVATLSYHWERSVKGDANPPVRSVLKAVNYARLASTQAHEVGDVDTAGAYLRKVAALAHMLPNGEERDLIFSELQQVKNMPHLRKATREVSPGYLDSSIRAAGSRSLMQRRQSRFDSVAALDRRDSLETLPSDQGDVAASGFLEEKRRWRNVWKRRFCVVDRVSLIVYSDETCAKEIRRLELSNVTWTNVSDVENCPFAFALLQRRHRPVVLRCKSFPEFAKWQEVFQNASINIEMLSTVAIEADERMRVVGFNARAEKFFGWSREEVMGKNVKLFMPADIAKTHDSFVQRYLRTSKRTLLTDPRVLECKCRDGSIQKVQVALREYYSADKKRVFLAQFAEEDVELRKMESQLSEDDEEADSYELEFSDEDESEDSKKEVNGCAPS